MLFQQFIEAVCVRVTSAEFRNNSVPCQYDAGALTGFIYRRITVRSGRGRNPLQGATAVSGHIGEQLVHPRKTLGVFAGS